MRPRTVVFCLLFTLTFALSAHAQPRMATVATDSPVFLKPDRTREPLRVVKAGTILRVIEVTPEWVLVEFNDPQWGVRRGYIEAKAVKLGDAPRTRTDPSDRPSTPVQTEAPVAVARSPSGTADSASTEAARHTIAFVDFSLGGQRAYAETVTNFVDVPYRRETFSANADYQLPAGAWLEVGGGALFGSFGFGVTISGAAHKAPATVTVSVPDLFAFNNAAEDTATTEDLQRTEGAVHFRGIYAYSAPHALVKVFAGPSFFRLQQELVNDVEYAEAFLPHDLAIVRTPVRKYDNTGWGFNVGTDIAYFFNQRMGVGGTVEYSKAKVTMPVALAESFASTTFDYPVGGIQFGAGLRFRF